MLESSAGRKKERCRYGSRLKSVLLPGEKKTHHITFRMVFFFFLAFVLIVICALHRFCSMSQDRVKVV